MECSKKQLVIFTIINFIMVSLMILCVIVMKFNLLSLILSLFSVGSIFFSSINIWRQAKQHRNQ